MHGSFSPAVARMVRADRALVRQLDELGGGMGTMIVHSQRAWASVTFNGSRHTMTWAFDGAEAVERAELLIERLADHDFSIPGHLVADAAVESADHIADPPRMVVELMILLLETA